MVGFGTHYECASCGTGFFMNARIHDEPAFCPSCGTRAPKRAYDSAVRFSDPGEHPFYTGVP